MLILELAHNIILGNNKQQPLDQGSNDLFPGSKSSTQHMNWLDNYHSELSRQLWQSDPISYNAWNSTNLRSLLQLSVAAFKHTWDKWCSQRAEKHRLGYHFWQWDFRKFHSTWWIRKPWQIYDPAIPKVGVA